MNEHRYRFSRAGVRNVWQYDEQEFDFAGGRLLLRGTNGAGKSKTLEMLLPFVLDGDSGALDATGRRGAGLVWLMDQGRSSDSGSRLGYVWVELTRTDSDGSVHARTFGVGLQLSASAKTVRKWFFSTTRRIGYDLALDGANGLLTMGALRDELAADGEVFDSPTKYRAYVGRILFGLDEERYDELLRLLYWLRRPQVGEEIDPRKIAAMLSQALPALPEEATRTVGSTLDELTAFGEKIARREDALVGLQSLADAYRRYATGVVAERSTEVSTATAAHLSAQRALRAKTAERDGHARSLAEDRAATDAAETTVRTATATLDQLRRGPGADRRRELELQRNAVQAERSTAADLVRRAGRERARAARSHAQVDTAAERWSNRHAELHRGTAELADVAARLGAGSLAVPEVTDTSDTDAPAAAELLAHTTARWQHTVQNASGVGSTLAQLRVTLDELEAALDTAQSAERTASSDQQRAEERESAAERREGLLADAQRSATAAEEQHLRQVEKWAVEPGADGVDTAALIERDTWDAAAIRGLRAAADDLAAPHLDALGAERAMQQNTALSARTDGAELTRQRELVAAERDPSPPAPNWPRQRRDTAGVPLWRLIDARPGLSDADRAGVEAALEAAGLLDALVLPDGTALAPETLDVVLIPGAAAPAGQSLATLLAPEPDSPVASERVRTLLESIAITGDGPAVIGAEGRFALGPLRGRSSKTVAQYLGASARAAERLRRLAELDAQIADARQRQGTAEQRAQAVGARLQALRDWLNATPAGHDVLDAWRAWDGATTARDEARVAAADTARAAERSRLRFVELTEHARALATTAGVPPQRDAVRARLRDVNTARTALDRLPREVQSALELLQTWSDAVAQFAEDAAAADNAAAATAIAESALVVAEASYVAAKAAADPELRELDAKIGEASARKRSAGAEVDRLRASVQTLIGAHATAAEQMNAAESALADAEVRTHETADALRQLASVTGLVDAAVTDRTISTALLSAPEGSALVSLARQCQQLVAEQPSATVNELHQAAELARTTPAADLDPRLVVEHNELWSAQAELAGAQAPIAAVVENLAARVAEDRTLLSDKERRLFEVHLLGDLGEALRTRLAEARDLIAATNRILNDVKTSQGIRVRIDWAVRDDADAGTAEAVRLLLRMSQLSGTERDRLRDLMHGIIESSRAAAPDRPYTEHLATALDYRLWHQVTVRITRPEWTGTFKTLTSRTGLSQGEQKVVCYLPLFAAAAAHFTSLAGASTPYAPRFILLDDAFPKIDVRTHPLLFGLLVDLDLDFVITSERLWGDTDRVPSLAIYETLRAPGEVGVAQYHYHWDGTRRHALGDE